MPTHPVLHKRPSTQKTMNGDIVGAAAIIGAPVYTSDGRCLGKVKDVSEECVLIDVRFAFDYWLSSRAIAAVGDGEVRLGIEKRRVADYLVDPDCLQDFDGLPPVSALPVVLLVAQ